jgi:hypothetical protein
MQGLFLILCEKRIHDNHFAAFIEEKLSKLSKLK